VQKRKWRHLLCDFGKTAPFTTVRFGREGGASQDSTFFFGTPRASQKTLVFLESSPLRHRKHLPKVRGLLNRLVWRRMVRELALGGPADATG